MAAVHRLISEASTNATLISSIPGRILALQASTTSPSARFLKIYNVAVEPVVGTDIPALTLRIPPSGHSLAFVLTPPGIAFPAGIGAAMTVGMADTDTTPVGAAETIWNIVYD